MGQEYELCLSTATPVPFKDEKTNLTVFVELMGTATVVPINTERYPDREAVVRLGTVTAQSLVAQVLMDLSGRADALNLSDKKKEIEKNLSDALKGAGLQVTGMEFFKLGPDKDSEKRLKMGASFSHMTNDVSMNSAPAQGAASMAEMMKQASAMAAAAAAANTPAASEAKFCMYCGTKITGKYCTNCGALCRH